MAFGDHLSPEEQATLDLVTQLLATGNLRPLIARQRAGELGLEHAREALRTLGELDLDLLVQIMLEGLVTVDCGDPQRAMMTGIEPV